MGGTIHIMDTSVYLELMKIPGCYSVETSSKLAVELENIIKNGDRIIIPIGTIIESGNNIVRAANGRRYDLINRFIDDVNAAIESRAPYSIGKMGDEEQLIVWLSIFRELAHSQIEFGDVTCIAEFNLWKDMKMPVEIWSDDKHLQSYKYSP